MTTQDAATICGCSKQAIAAAIRRGALPARKIPDGRSGFRYVLRNNDVLRFKSLTQTRGWPRGKKRS